jgi:zinc protease
MGQYLRRLAVTAFALLLLVPAARATTEPGVLRATLENGLRVIIVEDHLAPVATAMVNYLVGSNEAPAGFPGTAHALEHMMFRGSPDLSADQLATIMAALGGDSNADTQQTVTQYFITVPVEELESALRVEALRMRGLDAAEELWGKERGAIEQEVAQDLSEPMYLFHTSLQARMFAGTPFAVDPLGSKDSFEATTGAMLKEFHRQWYGPNNAVLVIVGDLKPEQTLRQVQAIFGEIAGRPVPERPLGMLQPLTPARLDRETDLPYGLAIVAYRLPGYGSPDYAAGRILGDVLDSRRGKLYDLVTSGAAISAGFSGEERAPATVGYVAATYPKGGDGAALVKRLQGIIAAYRRDGLPAELVAAAKRQEIAGAQFAKNSTTGLAFAWSQAVAVEGRRSPDDDIAALRRVTVADVNRVARTCLQNESAITALLTPSPAGMAMAAANPEAMEAFAPREVKPVPLPEWAARIGDLKLPTPPPTPEEFRLANGLRVIVLPAAVSPTVSLYGEVRTKPEIQEPPGQEGVAALLAELFSYGTTSLDRRAYQKALDDLAASASAGTSFSLQVLADRFERGVSLLADNLLHPALPEAAFLVARQQEAGALAGELQSPDYRARRALLTALFPAGDPVVREATPETVNALRLADVKAYYRQVFRPDLTTIVLVGQVQVAEARRIITRYFGKWRAIGPRPEIDLPAVPLNKPSPHLVPDANRVQDRVALAQVGEVTRKSPDYYPLQVGMNVLAGGFYATRFFRELREETGLVYTVDGQLEAGTNRSLLSIAYGCDPENVGKARAVIEQELREMQSREVTPEELQQAKMLLLRQIPLSRASVGGIAGQYLGLVRDRLPLDEPMQAAGRLLAISAGEVREAFARRVRPDDLVQVTQGPPPR